MAIPDEPTVDEPTVDEPVQDAVDHGVAEADLVLVGLPFPEVGAGRLLADGRRQAEPGGQEADLRLTGAPTLPRMMMLLCRPGHPTPVQPPQHPIGTMATAPGANAMRRSPISRVSLGTKGTNRSARMTSGDSM